MNLGCTMLSFKGRKDVANNIKIIVFQNSQDGKTCFVKLHVPWPILIKYAERMKVKMPLKIEKDENEEPDDELCDCSWFTNIKRRFLEPFKLHNELIDEKVSNELLQAGNENFYKGEETMENCNYISVIEMLSVFRFPGQGKLARNLRKEPPFNPHLPSPINGQ